jgi:hypothetical protein
MSVAPLKTRSVQTITINTTHYVLNSNRYRFSFPTQIDLSRSRPALGVSQIALYNSIPNVSAALGNNLLTITWVDGISKTFTLSDGYYDASALNLFLQFAFAQSGWFLQSSSTVSQAIYFAQIEANAINYALEVDFFVVPKTLPAGYSLPPNVTWSLPTANAGRFCQITFVPGFLPCSDLVNRKQPILHHASRLQSARCHGDHALLFERHVPCSFAYLLHSAWMQSRFIGLPSQRRNLSPGALEQLVGRSHFANSWKPTTRQVRPR